MVEIYVNNGCGPCRASKRFMDSKGIKYVEKSLADPVNTEYVKSLGYTTAPIIITKDTSWSGFRLDELSKLV